MSMIKLLFGSRLVLSEIDRADYYVSLVVIDNGLNN